jgi:3'(2'), 5'-bisphosphate nucleotidase
MDISFVKDLVSCAIAAAHSAGAEIMDVYCTHSFEVEYKDDNSPLTLADRRAHHVIDTILSRTTIPVLSEEGSHTAFSERQHWRHLWLVDPLDGTKEFISRNGEFSVNIALVEDGVPVAGVIYAPVPDTLWVGIHGVGAYKVQSSSLVLDSFSFQSVVEQGVCLPYYSTGGRMVVVATRSHMNSRTSELLDVLKLKTPSLEVVHIGSALKFCLLAEGKASLYPRFAPTSEWDTAAGHAIVRSLGGDVLQEGTRTPLVYNKAHLENPGFVAYVDSSTYIV